MQTSRVHMYSSRLSFLLRDNDYTKEEMNDEVVYYLKLNERQTNRDDHTMYDFRGTSNPESMILLFVGEEGVGKTTVINGLVNHMYGVQFEDNFRIKLKEDIKKVDKRCTTSYKLPIDPKKDNETLVLIDTPGFGDRTERNKATSLMISRILQNKSFSTGITFVVVARASAVRMTTSQRTIYKEILSLYKQYQCRNMYLIATHADAKLPPVFTTIREAKLPIISTFQCNNLPHKKNEVSIFRELNQELYQRTSENYEKLIVSIKSMPKPSVVSDTQQTIMDIFVKTIFKMVVVVSIVLFLLGTLPFVIFPPLLAILIILAFGFLILLITWVIVSKIVTLSIKHIYR